MFAVDELNAALLEVGATVATAESLTAGRLAALLTEPPGASKTFRGGFVTYATELKHTLLGVPVSVIETVGVVSAECVAAMAAGARERSGATYGLATTGVAGPEEQEGKPVGTVYVGVSGPHGETTALLGLSGSRAEIQRDTCLFAVDELLGLLRREHRRVR
ncbi:CinA family protein [Nocardioides sp. NPDC047086]|uniref:CinA family protein n=1 Tax=Nocardioides sp. NPDC047086 TaxID=3154810 RepID=UPI003404E9AF